MSEEPSVGHLTNHAARLFRRLADQRLAPLGLSSGHLPVLTALIANPVLSQKALIELAAIEQPTMAATLARMERDGIVVRRPDPADRRSWLFSLTPATSGKAGAVRAVIESMNIEAFAGLSDEDRQRSRSMLKQMIAALERAVELPD